MGRVISSILWAACIAAVPARAQPTAAYPTAAGKVQYVPVGTKLSVRILADLTTKKKQAHPGQRFLIETVAPVMVGSLVVIPAQTRGEGEIVEARNKGMWGKSGFVEVRAVHLNMGGRRIRLTGGINDRGVTGTAAVVGAVMTSWPLGFIMTGTSARIPKGTAFVAILDEDVPFQIGEPHEASTENISAKWSSPPARQTASLPLSSEPEAVAQNGITQ